MKCAVHDPEAMGSNLYQIELGVLSHATRVKEHGTSPSAVQNHLSSCEPCKLNFSCHSFSVIDSGKNDYEITVREVLHIKFKRQTINKQLFTQGTHLC